MGKKGGWIAAIKKVVLGCRDNPAVVESGERGTREKKGKGKELGKPKYGKTKSLIPRFREPSSIEQILGEVEREHNLNFQPPASAEIPRTPVPEQDLIVQPPTPAEVPKPPGPEPLGVSSSSVVSPRAISPKASLNRPASPRGNSQRLAASPRIASPKTDPARATSSRSYSNQKETVHHPEPGLGDQHAAATKIQAAYRGFMARRSFRALKGLVRLHGVMRGNAVKRQTVDAIKYMQMSVRVQSQIRSRRIEMFESKERIQAPLNIDEDAESCLGKWNSASEFAGRQDIWDDSPITKEERDARVQRRTEAIINKERAKAYAYSNQQLWKSTVRSSSSKIASTELRSDGFPWWWSRLENHLPLPNLAKERPLKPPPATPPRLNLRSSFKFDNFDASTPRSSRSSVHVTTSRRALTPPSGRILGSSSSSKYSRQRPGPSAYPFNNLSSLKDEDNGSLISCPPFLEPHYMAPTASAKAKARASSNPRERPGTPGSEASRRLSFPMTPSSRKNYGSPRTFDTNSVMDTPVSTSSAGALGRKPFNRFV
ncbi:hypothetical protein MLD38_039693 [Melastoma candidum]|uniref:Uncharacterized protein n=1 Tax=Melastoma candidum TaxID=119954 RepID=A0ACB9L3C1_9MYRT|nr:hypothetical protein MLD38_039693 [Melastoma candidum]